MTSRRLAVRTGHADDAHLFCWMMMDSCSVTRSQFFVQAIRKGVSQKCFKIHEYVRMKLIFGITANSYLLCCIFFITYLNTNKKNPASAGFLGERKKTIL